MDRYDKLRKKARNQLLEQYAENNPDASLSEIGLVFNVSKQRVSELLEIALKRKELNKEVTTVP